MIVILLIIILVLFIIFIKSINNSKKEGFDAVGLVYNVPPNWFIKQDYNPSDWVVKTYRDTIQPECLSYSKEARYGSLDNINYLSSAYRFWRF